VTDIQNTVAGHATSITTLQSTVTDIQNTVAGHATSITTLQNTVTDIQNTVTSLQSRVTTVEANIATLQTQMTEIVAHMANNTIHITQAERDAWNNNRDGNAIFVIGLSGTLPNVTGARAGDILINASGAVWTGVVSGNPVTMQQADVFRWSA